MTNVAVKKAMQTVFNPEKGLSNQFVVGGNTDRGGHRKFTRETFMPKNVAPTNAPYTKFRNQKVADRGAKFANVGQSIGRNLGRGVGVMAGLSALQRAGAQGQDLTSGVLSAAQTGKYISDMVAPTLGNIAGSAAGKIGVGNRLQDKTGRNLRENPTTLQNNQMDSEAWEKWGEKGFESPRDFDSTMFDAKYEPLVGVKNQQTTYTDPEFEKENETYQTARRAWDPTGTRGEKFIPPGYQGGIGTNNSPQGTSAKKIPFDRESQAFGAQGPIPFDPTMFDPSQSVPVIPSVANPAGQSELPFPTIPSPNMVAPEMPPGQQPPEAALNEPDLNAAKVIAGNDEINNVNAKAAENQSMVDQTIDQTKDKDQKKYFSSSYSS